MIPTCGAAPAPVMPQVGPTWGHAESRETLPQGGHLYLCLYLYLCECLCRCVFVNCLGGRYNGAPQLERL